MNFVGIDLHKKLIVLCVMDQTRGPARLRYMDRPPSPWRPTRT